MTNIITIYTSVNSLVRGKDPITGHPLHFDDARKNVKKLLIEGVKVAAGIGGFIVVTRLMNQQDSSLAAAGVGALAIGGSLLLTSRVSVILYDATKITAGLVFFKKGCLDLAVYPAVASVKGIVESLSSLPSLSMPRLIYLPFVVIKNLALTYLSIGTGYFRLIGGALSLHGSLALMTSGDVKVPVVEISDDDDDDYPVVEMKPERRLIDRGIIHVVKKASYIVTRMFGYLAPNYRYTRNIETTESERSYSMEEMPPRPVSRTSKTAELAPAS